MGPDSESPVTVRNSDLDFGFTAGPRRDSEWRATRAPASLSIMIMVRAEAAQCDCAAQADTQCCAVTASAIHWQVMPST